MQRGQENGIQNWRRQTWTKLDQKQVCVCGFGIVSYGEGITVSRPTVGRGTPNISITDEGCEDTVRETPRHGKGVDEGGENQYDGIND